MSTRASKSRSRASTEGGEPAGTLVVVATPIGNLGDLSTRAATALEQSDLIACEDTRRTGRLLEHLGFRRPMRSLHEHNEDRRLPELLDCLAVGKTVALVSDAGTPLLCDPGYRLVRAAIESGHCVQTVPGPSASIAALTLSGLPPMPFTFCGFPPPKSGKRKRFYGAFAELQHTLVIFESPHRLLKSLEDALAMFGDRPAALSREITKLHEETIRGSLSELVQWAEKQPRLRGEFVVSVAGATRRG